MYVFEEQSKIIGVVKAQVDDNGVCRNWSYSSGQKSPRSRCWNDVTKICGILSTCVPDWMCILQDRLVTFLRKKRIHQG